MKIAIINYGLGNLGSVKNMLKKVGCTNVAVTSNPDEIAAADKLILPGVGAFDQGMKSLAESGLIPILDKLILEDKKSVLGICLGAQLMTKSSEEGLLPGLGWFDAKVKKFNFEDKKLKIPHMGWNEVHAEKGHLTVNSLEKPTRFYFVHSYYIKANNVKDVLLTCNYGTPFCAAIQHENMTGMQFHPEKSHKFGMAVFASFVNG